MAADESWVKPFRRQVRLSCATGWGVRNRHGKVQLRVEGVGAVMLDYPWSEEGSLNALERIRQTFKRYETEGLSLAKAAGTAETASSHQKLNWDELVAEFKKHRPAAGAKTWAEHYRPVLTAAGALMSGNGKKPRDGEELLLKALERWGQGTRMRQISRRNLAAFLTWAVQRQHLKPCYMPPAHIPEIRATKRVGYPLSDAQVLRLLDGIEAPEWRFLIQLCAEFGLRPEDARHLRVVDGNPWSYYRKSKGGRRGDKTEPRRLHSIPVRDVDGTPQQWNLALRLAAGEKLPSLREPGKASQAINGYLRRNPVWQQLKAEAERDGEELTGYSFRHRYVKEGHRHGIPIADLAKACGHSIEVHLQNYARFTPDSTAEAFSKALKL